MLNTGFYSLLLFLDFLTLGWFEDWYLNNRLTVKARWVVAALWLGLIPALMIDTMSPMQYSTAGITHYLTLLLIGMLVGRVTKLIPASIAYRFMMLIYVWLFAIAYYQWQIVGLYTRVVSF